MKSLAWIAYLLALSCAAEAQHFRIAGTVVDGVTGAPMERVHVSVYAKPSQLGSSITQDQSVVTGADGKFIFQVNGAGKYNLYAQRNGAPRQTYRADAGPSSLTAVSIVTGSDQVTDQLRFRYFPLGAIAGRILDENGEPVEDALVQLIRRQVVQGKTRFQTAGWDYANDLGEYRFGGITGGTYFLTVTATPWYEKQGRKDGSAAYPPVFYPATTDVRRAEPITVVPGQDVSANFTLRLARGYTVKVTSSAVRHQVEVEFTLSGIEGSESFQVVEDCNGSCEFHGMPEGRYTVRASAGEGSEQQFTSQSLEVHSETSLEIRFDSTQVISGKVDIKNGDPKDLPRIIVMARDVNTMRTWTRSVNPNGSFAMPKLAPARYRITVTGAGYIADEDNVIDLSAGPVSPLTIAASRGIGRVKGTLLRDGKPYAGGIVALVPKDLKPDEINYRGFVTDSDGSFDMENLRPGNYLLVFSPDADFEYGNPDAIKPLVKSGKPIHIGAGDSFTETLELPR